MTQSLRRVLLDTDRVPGIRVGQDCSEERIATIIRKIGFVAACIDLYRWRNVIDQVLREIEAERRSPLRSAPERP